MKISKRKKPDKLENSQVLKEGPLKNLSGDIIPIRKKTHVVTDDEIAQMDERNLEVEELTKDYIIALMGQDGYEVTIEDLVDDDEFADIVDSIEELLANHGIFIERPTLVQRDDGEYIVPNAYGEAS